MLSQLMSGKGFHPRNLNSFRGLSCYPCGYRNVRFRALIPPRLPEKSDAIRATIPAGLPFPAAELHKCCVRLIGGTLSRLASSVSKNRLKIRRNNVRTIRLALVAVVAAGLLMAGTQFHRKRARGILPVVHAAGGCSNSSLHGSYGSQINGNIIGFGPIAGVAVVTYDGAGNFTQTDNVNVNGFGSAWRPGSGTYSVNADCTGTQTLNLPGGQVVHSAFVITAKEGFVVVTDPGAVITAVSKPVGALTED